ncbi:MAG: hypothetical protein HC788_15585 [Sphingopyxis sp.]|nr:hypothetical protein [Sphingopyxis sp.]
MDRKLGASDTRGRRMIERRVADDPSYAGPERRAGGDRRETADRRRRPA